MERTQSNGSKSQRREKPRAPQPPFETPPAGPSKEEPAQVAAGDRSGKPEPEADDALMETYNG